MSEKIDGVYRALDLTEPLWQLYQGKSQKRYDIGFDNAKDCIKIIKPSFMVITGIPNCGKSSWTYDVLMRTAKMHNFKYLIFSPEHNSTVNLKRLIEKYCKKPFDIMFKNRVNESEVIEAIEFIQEHFYFLDKSEESPNIDWILDRARKVKEVYDIDGMLLDPYNEICPARNNLREDEHISVLISKIKRFNRETETVTFMVAHPTKQIRNADGVFEVKSLFEISGTAHWANKCDVGIIVTRDYERGCTKIRIAKVREVDVQGVVSEFTIAWNNDTKCYDDI
tara:strand:- start:20499 stop:21341 length:843 start_codon:yes stop_codon:yes gene_type:complete